MLYKQDWEETKLLMTQWWAGDAAHPLLQVTAPKDGAPAVKPYTAWEFLRYRENPQEAITIFENWAAHTYFGGVAYPHLRLNIGPVALAAQISGYLSFDAATQTAWFEQELEWDTIEQLALKDENLWWAYTREIATLAASAAAGKFIVSTASLGGIHDVLAAFRGTQTLLMDMFTDAERIEAQHGWIEDAWHSVYDTINKLTHWQKQGTSAWMGLWCAEEWYPLQSDYCAMISPRDFDRFVLPSLERQAEKITYPLFHLDGPGQLPHLDMMLAMPKLCGIQWVPGAGNPPCEDVSYYPVYEKILNAGKLLVLQSFDDPNGVQQVFQDFPSGRILATVSCASESHARELLSAVS